MRSLPEGPAGSLRWSRVWAIYLVFLVYGSLVPLEFRPLSLSEALGRFRDIPWLHLGVVSRADWVANLVLYVPVGYGAAAFLCRSRAGLARVAGAVSALVLGAGLALGVEFAQVFFPRTVSLNDLAAEGLGTAGGVVLALAAGRRVDRLWQAVRRGGPASFRAALVLYALFYAAYALFPFDFLVSVAELKAKWHSGLVLWGWGAGPDWPLQVAVLKLCAEVIAALPLGILAALSSKRRMSVWTALAGGLLLGGTVETAQFFIASGMSQGASVVTMGLGFGLGVLGAQRIRGLTPEVAGLLWTVPPAGVAALWLVYVGVLVVVNWAGRGALETWAGALDKLRGLSFIPFYYHYYLPETRALFSALSYLVLYLPVGALVGWTALLKGVEPGARARTVPGAAAAGIALVFESGKLFFVHARPDVTNLLIAGLAGWLGWQGMHWLVSRALTTRGSACGGRLG